MNIKEQSELVHQQIDDLTEKYRGLSCVSSSSPLAISGKLSFSAQYNGVSMQDEYTVEITVPEDYPQILPSAKEIGGRISKDFHTYPDDTLCLGSPIETRIKFRKQETLIGFVEDLLIPFLYSHSYKDKFGKMPYGELAHGTKGLIESYKGLLQVDDDMAALALLKILADDNYRGHINCPCGLNYKLRNCHGVILRDMKNYETPEEYLCEYVSILSGLQQKNQKIPEALLTRKTIDKIGKLLKKK